MTAETFILLPTDPPLGVKPLRAKETFAEMAGRAAALKGEIGALAIQVLEHNRVKMEIIDKLVAGTPVTLSDLITLKKRFPNLDSLLYQAASDQITLLGENPDESTKSPISAFMHSIGARDERINLHIEAILERIWPQIKTGAPTLYKAYEEAMQQSQEPRL